MLCSIDISITKLVDRRFDSKWLTARINDDSEKQMEAFLLAVKYELRHQFLEFTEKEPPANLFMRMINMLAFDKFVRYFRLSLCLSLSLSLSVCLSLSLSLLACQRSMQRCPKSKEGLIIWECTVVKTQIEARKK